ncbi:MAG: 50S ribosomal protein L16, partial [Dolichospermum sp.]|nr:50S ribosomal protein L16 [Dolichospermum sp.]
MRLADAKLPIKTKFIARSQPQEQE